MSILPIEIHEARIRTAIRIKVIVENANYHGKHLTTNSASKKSLVIELEVKKIHSLNLVSFRFKNCLSAMAIYQIY